MHLLVDADSIVYAAGFLTQKTYYRVGGFEFATKTELNKFLEEVEDKFGKEDVSEHLEVEDVSHALQTTKHILNKWLRGAEHTTYQLYLSGQGNFRKDLSPTYKAHRTTKPEHYQAIRDYLCTHWGATVVHGMEADDVLSVEQWKNLIACCSLEAGSDVILPHSTCIVSIDKDLDNTPGWRYNPSKDITYAVTQDEAMRNFYRQVLSGDSVDNVKGLGGLTPSIVERFGLRKGLTKCGKQSAIKIIPDTMINEQEIYDTCLDCYQAFHEEGLMKLGRYDMLENLQNVRGIAEANMINEGRLVWMTRELDDEGEPVLWRSEYGED